MWLVFEDGAVPAAESGRPCVGALQELQERLVGLAAVRTASYGRRSSWYSAL
jgi:hypothetical protein